MATEVSLHVLLTGKRWFQLALCSSLQAILSVHARVRHWFTSRLYLYNGQITVKGLAQPGIESSGQFQYVTVRTDGFIVGFL